MTLRPRLCVLGLATAVACSYDARQLAGPPKSGADGSSSVTDGSVIDTVADNRGSSDVDLPSVKVDSLAIPFKDVPSGDATFDGRSGGTGGTFGEGGVIGTGGSTGGTLGQGGIFGTGGGTGGMFGQGGISSTGGASARALDGSVDVVKVGDSADAKAGDSIFDVNTTVTDTPLAGDVVKSDGADGVGGDANGGVDVVAIPTAWVNRTPAVLPLQWPTKRHWHSLVFDRSRKTVVLFGGGDLGGFRSDMLWEWDGAAGSWSARTPDPLPTSWPTPRYLHEATFDSGRNRMVIYGGWNGQASVRELWEWDGNVGVWSNRTPTALPASWPPAKGAAALVYDASRGVAVLFGDVATGDYHLWEWNGTSGTWTDRTPSPLPNMWPTPRTFPGMVYDPIRKKIVLFGGSYVYPVASGNLANDTWEWDGTAGTWSNRTPSPLPVSWPSARTTVLAFDSSNGRVLLWGGEDATGKKNDLWAWSGADGTWSQVADASAPPPARTGHAMAFDDARRSLVTFGGYLSGWNGDGLDDLWER